MTHLFNRQLILQKLKFGNGEVLTGPFLPHTTRYNDKAKDYDYDVQAALQLLAEAGIKDTDGDGWLDQQGQKFSFTMMLNTEPFIVRYASIFQEDLHKVGIDMQLQSLDYSVLIDRALKKEFDATFFKWGVGNADDIVDKWHSSVIEIKGGYNFISYQNPQVDALLEAAQVEFDDAKRDALYREVHAHLAEDQPYTFLFADYYLMAVSKRFGNVKMYPHGYSILEWQVP
jgi:peptide/nickel transport system substrate-binding protein